MNDEKNYIELCLDGEKSRITMLYSGQTADKLKDVFARLLVCAGFPPSVLNTDDEEGGWVWLSKDEKIVAREEEE